MSETTLTESQKGKDTELQAYLVYVLCLDDLLDVRTSAVRLPDLADGPLVVGRDAATTRPVVRDGGVGIPDAFMSGRHFVLERGPAGTVIRDERSKNGTFVNGDPIEQRRLVDGSLIQVGHSLLCYREVAPAVARALEAPPAELQLGPTRTFCPEVAALLRDLTRIAGTSASVLIQGETGVGKEVAARAVHALSRREGAFRAVDCGAIPETMFESTLFGHRRGAFTGATDRRVGEIARADRGTMFFDEVGNLPPANQAKLLRVLEERRVFPLGAEEHEDVDVRWIAASNVDLAAPEARFRPDLLRRLVGFTLRLPPLRRRGEDLGVLTAHFLSESGARRAAMTVEAARRVYGGTFPGNLRQLRSQLLVAAALAGDEPIALAHVDDGTPPSRGEPASGALATAPAAREPLTREAVEAALAASRGNVSAVAQRLGTNRREVYRLIHGHGISLDRYRE